MNRVGENIRRRRIELQMTQTDLARKLGYTAKSSISEVESGKQDLTLGRIELFANALSCSVIDLIDIETQNSNMTNRIMSYYTKLISAYNKASPKEKKAVCTILDIDYVDDKSEPKANEA